MVGCPCPAVLLQLVWGKALIQSKLTCCLPHFPQFSPDVCSSWVFWLNRIKAHRRAWFKAATGMWKVHFFQNNKTYKLCQWYLFLISHFQSFHWLKILTGFLWLCMIIGMTLMASVSYYAIWECHRNCVWHPAFSVWLFFVHVVSVIFGRLQFLFYSTLASRRKGKLPKYEYLNIQYWKMWSS